MKCPYCNYTGEGEYSLKTHEYTRSTDGDFFKLENTLRRKHGAENEGTWEEMAKLFGCPKCLKTFIEK